MKKWKGNLALVILCISICICSCGKADTIIPAQEVPMQSHAVITLDEIPEYSGIP